MIPLSEPNISLKEWEYLKKCLDTNWVSSSGGFVLEFEKEACRALNARYAVACINGTSGLFLALKLSGVRAGDEVIVPTLTFIAPVNTVRYTGAHPVFMDCDGYMNLDAGKLEDFLRRECRMTKNGLQNKTSRRIIRAVLPVHIFGNPCAMERIMDAAGRYGLKVVEDATESLGAHYSRGRYKGKFTGTIGDFGVFSFNGNKIITTGGGGLIVTAGRELAQKARYLTEQAKDDPIRSIHNEIGYNLRLSNLQAALGIAQFKRLWGFIRAKKRNLDLYRRELSGISGITVMDPPAGTRPNYWFYSLLVEGKKYGMDRERLMNELTKCNIQTRPVWYLNHLQRPYRGNQAYRIEKADWFWKRVLNVPCSTNLTARKIKLVSGAIRRLGKR